MVIRQINAVKDNLSVGRLFQQVQAAQEGALSRTGRSDNHDDFAFLDGNVDAAKHLILSKGLVQIFYFYQHVRPPISAAVCLNCNL